MATKVGPEKDKGSKTRQLSQRSHACFRLSAATVKRDLKGGALRFESTCADDDGAEGRFHQGLSDYCFTSRLLSRAPVRLPSYGGCRYLAEEVLCVPSCRLARATVKVAGSAAGCACSSPLQQ